MASDCRRCQSRDIRAPNLSERFAAQSRNHRPTVLNTFTRVPFQIQNLTGANTALNRKSADPRVPGVVSKPSWFPGFSASLDSYRIAL